MNKRSNVVATSLPEAQAAGVSVVWVHGGARSHALRVPEEGLTLDQVRRAVGHILAIPARARAYLDENPVAASAEASVLAKPGSQVDYLIHLGSKG